MACIAMTLAVPDLTGASRMLFYYARALVRAGHDVSVIHGKMPRDESGQTVSIVGELRDVGVRTVNVPLLSTPIPPVIYRQICKAAGNVDVIIGVNQRDRAVAARVGRMLSVPCALAVQSVHNFWGPWVVPRVKRWYYQRTVRECVDLFVCSSEVVMSQLVDDFGICARRCEVIPNGIEMTEQSSQDVAGGGIRSQLGLSDQHLIFSNVGRLDVQKGQDVLIKAWGAAELAENCHLVLVGDVTEGGQYQRSKAYKVRLQSLASELGVEGTVHFLGWRDDVNEILSESDVYVHSARWEGWPLAMMEAMSAGLPIIATDCSGYPQGFVKDMHGRIVEADSVPGLCTAIRDYAKRSKSNLRNIGAAANELCRREYNIENTGKRFVDAIEKLLPDAATPAR